MIAHDVTAIREQPSTALPTEEEARAFLQHRVARFTLAGGSLSTLFLTWRTLQLFDSTQRSGDVFEASYFFHAGGAAMLLGAWLFLRVGRKSPRIVGMVESLSVVGSSLFHCAMGVAIPVVAAPNFIVVLALTYILFSRAIYVPSTARRSLIFALLIGLGYLTMVWIRYRDVPPELLALLGGDGASSGARQAVMLAGSAVWWAATTIVSTLATSVIYGLRREVRDVKKLGQYTLDEKLGEGGMGIVYRASHAMLQRPTAVKLLPVDKVGETSLARFEREVRLTASLTHPNTVTVFDYGRTPEGVFYYAMELLDGATLDDVVDLDGALPPARVVHILCQVCGALAEAHEVGLIHRDVKPANIMLCERGGISDTVKVLDFGLVKQVMEPTTSQLTVAGAITGTPQYMSPEAIIKPDEVDARGDIYAVGAIAYLLLTGQDVFVSDNIVEVCSHHLHTPPRPPSELVKGLPADLETVVMSCLAKKPEDRPQSAGALSDAFAACDVRRWTRADARAWWQDKRAALKRRLEEAAAAE